MPFTFHTKNLWLNCPVVAILYLYTQNKGSLRIVCNVTNTRKSFTMQWAFASGKLRNYLSSLTLITPSSRGITTAMFISSDDPSNLFISWGFRTFSEWEDPTVDFISAAIFITWQNKHFSGLFSDPCCQHVGRCTSGLLMNLFLKWNECVTWWFSFDFLANNLWKFLV